METYAQPEDRKVRVIIEATDFGCDGLVHLPGIRLSDLMNEKSQFLVVVSAVLRLRAGGVEQSPVEMGTIFINKNDIKYIVPIDDARPARF
jgi:hypothetical protein